MPMQPGSPQAQMPAREDALIRKIQELERDVREFKASVPGSVAPWAARTGDGAVAEGTKAIFGDPGASRVELDSAGLRKYATDGTTVQVDLTGEVAAFSGLITGSEIIGGTFKTATSGNRIMITPNGPGDAGLVRFYTGEAAEINPALIWTSGTEAGEFTVGQLIVQPSEFGSRLTGYLALSNGKHATDSEQDYTSATLDSQYISIGSDSTAEIFLEAAVLYRDLATVETYRGAFSFARWGALRLYVVDSSLPYDAAGSLAGLLAFGLPPTVAAPLLVWDTNATPGQELKYTTNGTTWTVIGGGGGGTPASETVAGIVELATSAETVTGTDTVRATTPAGVKAAIDPWATSSSHLLFTPTGNLDTPASGTATWMTLGNVTVPAWATKADVVYAINGIYQITAAANVTVVMKIGTVAGAVSKRILTLPTDPSTPRSNLPIMDTFTGLTSGVKSVTLSATWVIAAGAYRADVNSYVTALFTWRP